MFSPFCRISDSKIDCIRGTLKPVHPLRHRKSCSRNFRVHHPWNRFSFLRRGLRPAVRRLEAESHFEPTATAEATCAGLVEDFAAAREGGAAASWRGGTAFGGAAWVVCDKRGLRARQICLGCTPTSPQIGLPLIRVRLQDVTGASQADEPPVRWFVGEAPARPRSSPFFIVKIAVGTSFLRVPVVAA